MIKIIKQLNIGKLENRIDMVRNCQMTQQVFLNCAGFLQISVRDLPDSNDEALNLLDSTRIHPVHYEEAKELARQMLDVDEDDDDPDQNVIERILAQPHKAMSTAFDIVAYSVDKAEQEREQEKESQITQEGEDPVELSNPTDKKLKGETLFYMIKAANEFCDPFSDNRTPRSEPQGPRLFELTTGESYKTLYPGKLVTGVVSRFFKRPPRESELENADAPEKNADDHKWKCKFCGICFDELPELWAHLDERKCEGRCIGFNVDLDCNVQGFCKTENVSSQRIDTPEERVTIGQIVNFKIFYDHRYYERFGEKLARGEYPVHGPKSFTPGKTLWCVG